MQFKKYNINEIKCANYNPRKKLKENDVEYELLKKSILKFGLVDPLIINEKTNTLVGGHQRLQVLKDLKYKEIECVVINVGEEEEKALNVALNKIQGTWELDKLKELLQGLEAAQKEITGFSLEELSNLLNPLNNEKITPEEKDYVIKNVVIKNGDLIYLDRHKIYCGSCTDSESFKKLFEDKKADLMVTDPPYGINYNGGKKLQRDKIKNDDLNNKELQEFLTNFLKAAKDFLKPTSMSYIFYAMRRQKEFTAAVENAGLTIKDNLIWLKNHFTLNLSDYQYIYEPILYVKNGDKKHFFISERNNANVLKDFDDNKDFSKMKKEELVEYLERLKNGLKFNVIECKKQKVNKYHPTEKPVKLIKELIKNSSKIGDIVLDCFLGGGSTLIAAEEMETVCYGIEIEEKYCQAAIIKYLELTKKDPQDIKILRDGELTTYKELIKE